MTGARKHAEASVEILKVEDAHSGDYTCVASTDLDRKESTAHLDVLDVPKPPFTPTIVSVRVEGRWHPQWPCLPKQAEF